jgi:hypothetical protein
VITGNWGNDLTLLVKAAREVGFDGRFYTFYGNALGAPAAIGEAGVGKRGGGGRLAAQRADARSEAFYQSFRKRFPNPADDYVHMRLQLMIEALAQAIDKAGTHRRRAVALALEQAAVSLSGQRGRMRAADHQFQQPLVVGVMDRQGTPGVKFDVEGSGYGFRVVRQITPPQAECPRLQDGAACLIPRPPPCVPAILNLEESKIREVANAGMGRSDVLAFWFGESDEVTPDFIRQAAIESLQRRRDLLRAQPRPAGAARGHRALHVEAARTGGRRAHRRHVRRRQCADARGAGAGGCRRRGRGGDAGLAQPHGAARRSWARS